MYSVDVLVRRVRLRLRGASTGSEKSEPAGGGRERLRAGGSGGCRRVGGVGRWGGVDAPKIGQGVGVNTTQDDNDDSK